MDAILESTFSLDPSRWFNEEFEEFDPMEYFNTDDIFETFSEATAPVTKEGLWERLVNSIKKAGAWIMQKLSKIAAFFKKLVGVESKSPDTIATSIGINPSDKYAHDAAQDLFENFIAGVSKDGVLLDVAKLVSTKVNVAPIKGKNIHAGGKRASMVIALMLDPKPLDEYITTFQKILNDFSITNIKAVDIDNLAVICNDFKGRPSLVDYGVDEIRQHIRPEHNFVTIRMDELLAFQKKVDEICKLTEEYDSQYKELNINIGDKGVYAGQIKKYYMDMLNDLAWVCVNLQGGLHAISNGLMGIYQLSKKFWGTVTDPDQLAKFVEECMKSGMPGKYIVNNIYNICDPVLKGNPNVDEPIMGFGRLTLIPEGDIIYKVAINRYGVRSNKNDYRVMDVIKGSKIESLFAFTTKTYGDYTINVMEKVQAGKKHEPPKSVADQLGNMINQSLKQMNAGFSIYDIKPDAFGQKDGKYVILDYGYLQRTDYDAKIKDQ